MLNKRFSFIFIVYYNKKCLDLMYMIYSDCVRVKEM
jgi:hypothetical protein